MTMNNNVSVEGVENIANTLKEIAAVLKDDYNSISTAIFKINNNIETLRNFNGQDAIEEPYPYEISYTSEKSIYSKQYYKYVWDIQINGGEALYQALSSTLFQQFEENIDLLDMKSDDLNLLAGTLYGFITTLSSLLQVDFDGNIKNFFTSIKDNEGFKETKK